MAQKLKTDWILFAVVLGMVSFGVLILYSASSIMAQLRYGSTWHFVARQAAWAAVAVVAMMTLKRTHYRTYQNPAVAFSAIGVALVLLAGVYLVDTQHHRWLRMGPIGLQPSELAKPALVIFLAFFVTWRARAINNPRYTLVPAALAVGLVILAVVVADLGTAVVLGGTAAIVFFVAGLELRYCAIAAAVASIGVCIFIATSPYRLARVVKFFDPEFKVVNQFDRKGRIKAQLEKSLTTRDTNYQLQQSKIAVGAGGPAGVGLMNGKQKLLYLPEAHTDFIYAVICEELGFIGALIVIALFAVYGWRGLRAAFAAPDGFGRLLALGITAMVIFQALINFAVVLGMVPTKGIPLPFISYGGSSLLVMLLATGVLLNISQQSTSR